jgi:Protein of unknown function (DUF2635)
MMVYPVTDRIVRDPLTMLVLPAEGWDVPDDDFFYSRRLRDGDCSTVSGSTFVAPVAPKREG